MTEHDTAPAAAPAPPPKPAARKPASRPAARDNTPRPFGGALIASLSRLDRPGIGDPYQSGQRLWPD